MRHNKGFVQVKISLLSDNGTCEACGTAKKVTAVKLAVYNSHGKRGSMKVNLCPTCTKGRELA